MASYSYRCDECDIYTIERHSMTAEPTITCDKGHEMRRIIDSVPFISWGGMPPSQGDISQFQKDWIANAPYERDELAKEKERRGDN